MATTQCKATTKNGDRCRNHARPDSDYCGIHASLEGAPANKSSTKKAATKPPASKTPATKSPATKTPITDAPITDAPIAQVEQVAEQLNQLADEVHKVDPDFEPPPFSVDALLAMMQGNAALLAKYIPSQTLQEIIANLEGTTTKDLLDPETWKGLWYILNYSMQGQVHEVMEKVAKQLAMIPGMELMMQFGQSVIEAPGELLNVETWKGAFVVLNAAVAANVDAIKGKMSPGK